MKDFRLMLQCLIFVLAMAVGDVYAQTYVSEVAISSNGKSDKAKKSLTDAGYTVIGVDLNKSAGGDYIYLGYKTTTNLNEALTDLVVFEGGGYDHGNTNTYTIEGRTYNHVPYYGSDNLNNKAGGKKQYLWASKDKREEGVITSLNVHYYGGSKSNSNYVRWTGDGKKLGGACDVNSDAGGKYIYIEQGKTIIQTASNYPASNDAFSVIDLGGGMYHLTIPVGERVGDDNVYLFGGGRNSSSKFNTLYVHYLPKGEDPSQETSWKLLLQMSEMKAASGSDAFAGNWEATIIAASGNSLKFNGFQVHQGVIWEKIELKGGDASRLRTSDFLWNAGCDIAQVRLKADGVEAKNQNVDCVDLNMLRIPKIVAAPDDDMNVFYVTDPMLNFDVSDDSGTSSNAGTQKVQAFGSGNMLGGCVWDEDQKKVVYQSEGGTAQFYACDLPQYEDVHSMVFLAYGEKRAISDDGKMGSFYGYYAAPFELKPFHAIQHVKARAEMSYDPKTGRYVQQNVINWSIANVRSGDAMEDDQYVIERAYDPDFTDPVTVDVVSVDEISGSAVSLSEDGSGTYTCIDTDEEAWYNPNSKNGQTTLYYRVSRAVAMAQWGTGNIDEYQKSVALHFNNALLGVDSIRVTKSNTFDEDRTVTVRVELQQPVTVSECAPDAPLSFTAVGADMTIGMTKVGNVSPYSIQYSADGREWSEPIVMDENADIVTIPAGKTYYFRHGGDKPISVISNNNNNYRCFTMSGNGTIEAGGNVMTLLDKTGKTTKSGWQAFHHLFFHCDKLTKAPHVIATELQGFACAEMYSGCTMLKSAPELPCPRLGRMAYTEMFTDCTSLEYVGMVGGQIFSDNEYKNMFKGCTSLRQVSVNFTNFVEDGDKATLTSWLPEVAPDGRPRLVYVPASMKNRNLQLPEGWTLSTDSMLCPGIWDAEGASVTVQRYSPSRCKDEDGNDTGDDYSAKTISIHGEDMKWDDKRQCWYAEVEDVQSAPYTLYYYRAYVDDSQSHYRLALSDTLSTTKEEAEACYSETIAPIIHFSASRGTESGCIVVEWEVDEGLNDGFLLQRKAYGSKADWEDIALDDPKTVYYVDHNVSTDSIYVYRLTAYANFCGSRYQVSRETAGHNPYYGTINGRITLANGSAMPGAMKMKVSCDEVIDIPETVDAEHGDTIQAIHQEKLTRLVNVREDGTFSIEGLLYQSKGTKYTLEVDGVGVCFTAPNDEQGAYDIVLGNAASVQTCNFVCNDTKQFSGRVLYDGSTVPVRGAYFVVNGSVLTDGVRDTIFTDQLGNFSFQVPRARISVQVCKKGHRFVNDGYILSAKDDLQEYLPTEDRDGLRIYDLSRARLVGRIVGGDVQGELPLGYGLSHNNLGENLTLVFELEGDNTAQFVYNPNDPDNTTRHETVHQTVMQLSGEDTLRSVINQTEVNFEKRRIVVNPNDATGEFSVDLFPTKYKITRLDANGYATFFRAGEGFEILDLTNALADTIHHVLAQDTTVSMADDPRFTSYNATYRRVHHVPVSVTYQQNRFGRLTPYLGVDKIKYSNILGNYVTTQVASYDKEKDSVNYVFGYPVFQSGSEYALQVSAHEDFYFNGNTASVPDQVFLKGGMLTVRNGLEDDTSKSVYRLNEDGTCNIVVKAANNTFSLTSESALRTLSMEVELNGYYYKADDLKAFVTGLRRSGKNILPIGSDIMLLDVLRDPPGSKSFATREAGTTYKWDYSYSHSYALHNKLSLTGGPSAMLMIGLGTGFLTESSLLGTAGINITTNQKITNKNGQYTMTLSDNVTTSSGSFDQGSIADVYIGTTTTYGLVDVETFGIIDDTTYNYVRHAIDRGAVKIVQKGKTADGRDCYMAISQKGMLSPLSVSDFTYSQRYILNTLIPTLERQRDNLLRTGTKQELQAIADQTGRAQYRLVEERADRMKDSIEFIIPNNEANYINEVDTLNNAIIRWQNMIAANEEAKVNAMTHSAYNTHSVAGTTISHKETASTFWNSIVKKPANVVTAFGGIGLDEKPKEHTDSTTTAERNDNMGNYKKPKDFSSRFLGVAISLSWNIDNASSTSINNTYIKTSNMGYSYTLVPDNDANLNVSVYANKSDFDVDPELLKEMKDPADYNKGTAALHNFVFRNNGGACRNPWLPADSTLFYNPGTPLGVNNMKIDNPRIIVDNPVVSNLPQGERAVFSICLLNDSEISDNVQLTAPSTFTLRVDEASNPYGARVYMDGAPIGSGREIRIAPHQSITKVIEVERGAAAYDYEDLKLILRDAAISQSDEATISIHYLPSASPVHIAMPANKWVLNTLGAMDEKGDYYMPVKIDGFNVQHKNFDHIELQYKRQNEGDDKWVNLCSYYANDSLYAVASGRKEKIHSGSISDIRFYGEKDPVEAYYDLRAVSFSRLGTSYVTQASNVVSGTKDTRCPEVFGTPQPANGIVTHDDVISLRFNENIAYNILDETANFQVQGYVNNSDADHSASLTFPGNKEEQDARTKVIRNLMEHDFSIDMMVQLDRDKKGISSLFSQFDEEFNLGQDLSFLIDNTDGNEYLVLVMGGSKSYSVPLSTQNISVTDALTHVGVIYKASDYSVRFVVGDKILEGTTTYDGTPINKVVGPVRLGYSFKGRMSNVRLWDKALNAFEVANKTGKRLSKNEPGLIAYWPMNEGVGNVVADVVNGADIQLQGISWTTPQGYSLRIENKQVALKNTDKFQRDERSDYSLSFWYKADQLDGDSVTLFRAGDDMLADKGKGKMRINAENGELVLRSDSNVVSFGSGSYLTDKLWHRLTVVANHSHNVVRLYLDKNMVAQVDGSMVGGMTNEYIAFGDKGFCGNVDNISFWRLALPGSYISNYHNTAKTGSEAELAVNLPFERDSMKVDGSMITVFSPYSELKNRNTGADIRIPMLAEDDLEIWDEKQYAPIRSSKGLQNLPFSWTCTNTELQININKTDDAINHQNVNLVVRGVEDIAGNTMQNPQMWSVYFDRNMLVWNQQKVNIEQRYREGRTFRVGWRNKSGQRLSFNIENNTSWLACNTRMGQAGPLEEDEIEFTLSEGLAPGEHTATVYMTDENNLTSPLTLNVNVLPAEEANWEVVNSSEYSQVMNVIARVYVREPGIADSKHIDNDRRDVVAAFNQGVCLGKANITYDEEAGTSYVFLTVRGKAEMNPDGNRAGEPIEFRLWSASRGEILVLTPDSDVRFAMHSMVGSPGEPLELSETGTKVQQATLAQGWNWVSLNIKPTYATSSISEIFLDNSVFSNGDIIKRTGDGFFIFRNGNWLADENTAMVIGKNNVYQMYLSKPTTVGVVGEEYSEEERVITLVPKAAGNWLELPYLLSIPQPLSIAMSDYQIGDKALVGTIIKGHDAFAVATSTGWVGSLDYMYPNQGYYVRHLGGKCDIHFTNDKDMMRAPRRRVAAPNDAVASCGSAAEHATSMPVIAVFDEEMDCQEGDEVVAYAKGREVGRARMIEAGEQGKRFFLTINAEEGDKVSFSQQRDGKEVAACRTMLRYSGSAVAGSIEQPFVIGMKEDGTEEDADWFRLDGVRDNGNGHGIRVAKDKKVSR